MWVSASTLRISGRKRCAYASTSAKSSSGSSNGRWRISKSKWQSRGTMLSAVPPRMTPGVHRRVRDVVGVIELALVAERACDVGEVGDDLARDLDGVDAERRERRVRFVPAHAAAPALLALVRDDELHAGRLADDATERLDAARDDVVDQPPHADAADLLVVGQREMQRTREPAAHELGHHREPGRRKALHVGDPAADDPVSDQRRFERIGVPRLAVHRHDVGVPRQHDAARRRVAVARGQRRKEIRLAPVVVERQRALRAVATRDSRAPSRSARGSIRGSSCRIRPACGSCPTRRAQGCFAADFSGRNAASESGAFIAESPAHPGVRRATGQGVRIGRGTRAVK